MMLTNGVPATIAGLWSRYDARPQDLALLDSEPPQAPIYFWLLCECICRIRSGMVILTGLPSANSPETMRLSWMRRQSVGECREVAFNAVHIGGH